MSNLQKYLNRTGKSPKMARRHYRSELKTTLQELEDIKDDRTLDTQYLEKELSKYLRETMIILNELEDIIG